MGRILQTIAGEFVDENEIDAIAEKITKEIMSLLPEDAKTFDVALYVLKKAKTIIKGSRVKL